MSSYTDQTDEGLQDQHGSEAGPASPGVRSDRSAQRRNRMIRLAVLAVSLLGITVIGVLHQVGGIAKPVGVDALCPFGGVETLWSLLSGGGYLKRIAASSVILLMGTVVLGVVFGRAFCGYLCPLGALQEFFGMIGKAIWPRKRPTMPAALDRPARYLKYAVLAFFTIWTFQAAELVMRPYDPWVAWMHLTSDELLVEFALGTAVLGVSLAGSIVYERFFCKYLCPMGATLGLVSKISLFKVRRSADTCTSCGSCDRACPVNITVSNAETVRSAECLACNECVNACPVADTLAVSSTSQAAPGRSVSPGVMTGATLAIFVAIVGATTAAGAFSWTMPSLADTAGAATGAAAVINVEDIRGSMSFAEVSAATGIPAEAFEQQFGVQPSEMDLRIKDLAAKYGFDVHTDVREWVQCQIEAGALPASGAAAPAGGAAPAAEGAED